MVEIYIFEDEHVSKLNPLVHFRPAFQLVTGMQTLVDRITRHLGSDPHYICRPELKQALIEELKISENMVNIIPEENPILLINGRAIMDEELFNQIDTSQESAGISNGQVVYAHLNPRTFKSLEGFITPTVRGSHLIERLISGNVITKDISARLVHYPWDLVNANEDLLKTDFRAASTGIKGTLHELSTIVGQEQNVHLGERAKVGAFVVLDTTGGPIYIDDNAEIGHNAVINGPCYIGENSVIAVGGTPTVIHGGTYIGKTCKVSGEVGESILHGFVNKQHDGHLGHAYVCPWVNLGAGTTNSDLKNNYGEIRVAINKEEVNSHSIKVGCFIGDHTKTGIETAINTGSVISPFCLLVASSPPPKYLRPFSWIDETTKYDVERAISTERKVMSRRGIEMTKPYEDLIRQVWQSTFN